MIGSTRERTRLALAAAMIAALALACAIRPASATPAVPAPARIAPLTFAQGWCVYRVGDYPSQDHAFAVRSNLAARGLEAWIENHGSLYAGTRTYVVFARGPCR